MEYFIYGILAGVILSLLSDIKKIKTNVTNMNLTLDKIAKQVGVAEPTLDIKVIDSALDKELRSLIEEGKKIKAIKKLRMVTGFGLKEAKDYVDNLEGSNMVDY